MLDNIVVIFEVLMLQLIWLIMPACCTQEILMLSKEWKVLKQDFMTMKLLGNHSIRVMQHQSK
ncbi:MAG: hypothetical protein WCL28_04990 [bacterium]